MIAELDQRIAGQLRHLTRVTLDPASGDEDRRGDPLALEHVEHVAIEAGEVGLRGARVEGDRDGGLVGRDQTYRAQRVHAVRGGRGRGDGRRRR
jgi:hypothetical protein